MEQLSPEKLAQIKTIIKELDITPSSHSLIQDNKIIFPYNEKVYRTRMPNQCEQTLAEQAQNKLKIALIQEDGTITRKKLIKILKEKQDIDISQLEKDKEKLRNDLQDKYLELAVIDSAELEKIENLRNEKNNIEIKFMEISIEIIEMLSPCIEEQVKAEYYKYLAYLCIEKQVSDDLFDSVWKTYEEFGQDSTGLSYKAIENLQSLLLSIKE